MDGFDYLQPDYATVIRERLERLRRIRAQPECLPMLKAYYRLNPWQFVEDWGITYDPRNVERGLPAMIPFIPFPRQIELMKWVVDRWQASEAGLVPKSRDTGVSWCMVSLCATLALFYPGFSAGFGSRKEMYVDQLDGPKSLFYKVRTFLANLPPEFRGGWRIDKHAPYMRITFPESGSVLTGEAGDNIGRGDRVSIYVVDESAHLERPQLAEESLSATTNCRIDVSSVKGMGNPFAEKAHTWPAHRVFIFHWRSDPRKTEEWRAKLSETLDAVTIAQEYEINYSASQTGIVIPQEWVQSAVNAHEKLGLTISGKRSGALDVADEGIDLNAFAGRYGILLERCEAWTGKASDIFETSEKAFEICDEENYGEFRYDADGLGAGVRGDAKQINAKRTRKIDVTPFRGSAAVVNPDRPAPDSQGNEPRGEDAKNARTNKDYFKNLKAQSWWSLRIRFLRTHRAVTQGVMPADMSDLISLSPNIPDLAKLCQELSQATYEEDGTGKLKINKAPDGQRSPNHADAVMIAFAPAERKRSFLDNL